MKFNISLLFLIIFAAVTALASPTHNNNLAKRRLPTVWCWDEQWAQWYDCRDPYVSE